MIVNRPDGEYVEWAYQDTHGGTSTLSIPLEIYLVFVRQAQSLEELRCLCFYWPTRKTASARNCRVYKQGKGHAVVEDPDPDVFLALSDLGVVAVSL